MTGWRSDEVREEAQPRRFSLSRGIGGGCVKWNLVGIASRGRRAKHRGQRKSKRTADPSPREGLGMTAGRVGRRAPRDGAGIICYHAKDRREIPEWRNWQTRRTQNPVAARPCGFDPLLRDQRIPEVYAAHWDRRTAAQSSLSVAGGLGDFNLRMLAQQCAPIIGPGL